MTDFKIGDRVNYHPIPNKDIGVKQGSITRIIEMDDFGCDVAWITCKVGCVRLKYLTKI